MSSGIENLVGDFFRRRAGEITASLTRYFGPAHIEYVENGLQEAMIQALRVWPYQGLPDNPGAWIRVVARNRVIDALRRDRLYARDEIALETATAGDTASTNTIASGEEDEEPIRDDMLKMMFMCCHPVLSPTARIALTLKTLGGLGVGEIGRALLAREHAVRKLLSRARARLREIAVPFEIPPDEKLWERLESVLASLYLVFNEGYSANRGDDVVRRDLLHEAIRLASLLTDATAAHRRENAAAHALLSLMLLQAARVPARTDAEGNLVVLAEQDRTLWDAELIRRGMYHLNLSTAGDRRTVYHLQAAIAACHAMAGRYADTDWERILSLYDDLRKLDDSPVIALNRAVAVSRVRGPGEALPLFLELESDRLLRDYHLLPAAIADAYDSLGQPDRARPYYERALALAGSAPEKRFLSRKLGKPAVI